MNRRRPLDRRDFALAALGALVGVGVGAAATRWAMRRGVAPRYTDEERRQAELLSRLAEHTGYQDFAPGTDPLAVAIRRVQESLGIEPADGVWTEQTESAVLEWLSETPGHRSPPAANPAHELEPDENWELTYEREFSRAFDQCCADERVIAFDQAVVVLLERVFVDHGSFALAPCTGVWKRAARERARVDLAQRLGYTEIEARAVLARSVGKRALADGADFGQAIRTMAHHAWPTASWEQVPPSGWQRAFCEAASATLQSAA